MDIRQVEGGTNTHEILGWHGFPGPVVTEEKARRLSNPINKWNVLPSKTELSSTIQGPPRTSQYIRNLDADFEKYFYAIQECKQISNLSELFYAILNTNI
jgi:hypothetical protein